MRNSKTYSRPKIACCAISLVPLRSRRRLQEKVHLNDSGTNLVNFGETELEYSPDIRGTNAPVSAKWQTFALDRSRRVQFGGPGGWSIGPLSREYGGLKTVKARFQPWLAGKSPQNLSRCSLFAWQRTEQLLSRNVERFRGELVFKAHG